MAIKKIEIGSQIDMFVCDAISDIASISRASAVGSKAYILATGETYWLSPGGVWTNENNVLVKAQEELTEGLNIINTDHTFIHSGIAFKSNLYVGDLAAAGTFIFSLVIGEETYLHLKNIRLSGMGASVRMDLIRGTTANPLVLNSAGSTLSELTGPNNANDNSNLTSNVSLAKTPTYIDSQEGEIWDSVFIIGSSTNQVINGSDFKMGESFEYVLKSETPYVIKLTNLSSTDDAANVALDIFWYEQDSGIYS